MIYMNLPPEMYVYILSFLNPNKYEHFNKIRNRKCICYTNVSNFKTQCKMKTKHIFCHLHNTFSIYKTLTFLENKIIN